MRRYSGVVAVLLLGWGSAWAQVKPGDLAVIAFSSASTDSFSWVALRDLPSNTVINFTSSPVSNGWFRWRHHLGAAVGPGPLTWTGTNRLAAGTVVSWVAGDPKCWSVGLISGGVPALSTEGDQIFAYTGSIVSNGAGIYPWVGDPRGATLVFGLNFANGGWDNVTGGGGDTSFVPVGLSTNDGTAVHAGAMANGYYAGPRTGTVQKLLRAISVSSNWANRVEGMDPGLWCAPFVVEAPGSLIQVH